MDCSRQACRLCLSTNDFNISLFSSYCRKSNMLDKILVCIHLVVQETDRLTKICYKCAHNVEMFYNFITVLKQSQTKLNTLRKTNENFNNETIMTVSHRHIRSYVREVVDADYTFSFLDVSKNEDQKKVVKSTPFFSYLSSPKVLIQPSIEQRVWNTRARFNDVKNEKKQEATEFHPKRLKIETPRHNSIDLFESQSQDMEGAEKKSPDWALLPDAAFLKFANERFFGKSG